MKRRVRKVSKRIKKEAPGARRWTQEEIEALAREGDEIRKELERRLRPMREIPPDDPIWKVRMK